MKRTLWRRYEPAAQAVALIAGAFIVSGMWRALIANGSVRFRGVTLDFWPGVAVLSALTFFVVTAAGIWVYFVLHRESEPLERLTDPVHTGSHRPRRARPKRRHRR